MAAGGSTSSLKRLLRVCGRTGECTGNHASIRNGGAADVILIPITRIIDMSNVIAKVRGGVLFEVVTDDKDIRVTLVDYDIDGNDQDHQLPNGDDAYIEEMGCEEHDSTEELKAFYDDVLDVIGD